jgi:hypothetical protein
MENGSDGETASQRATAELNRVVAAVSARRPNCLRRGDHNLPRRYFRAAAKQIGVAWQMATGADLAHPEVQGRRGPATLLMNRYAHWALTACESDPITLLRFFKVNSLVDPPVRLLHPSFVFRAARVNLGRWKHRQPARWRAQPLSDSASSFGQSNVSRPRPCSQAHRPTACRRTRRRSCADVDRAVPRPLIKNRNALSRGN